MKAEVIVDGDSVIIKLDFEKLSQEMLKSVAAKSGGPPSPPTKLSIVAKPSKSAAKRVTAQKDASKPANWNTMSPAQKAVWTRKNRSRESLPRS